MIKFNLGLESWDKVKDAKRLAPGLVTALSIAILATLIEAILPFHFIGSAVLAMFLGISIRALFSVRESLESGLQFASKRVLKTAIVLMGATFNIGIILEVGSQTLFILLFTLFTAFFGSYLIRKKSGINWTLSNMIAAGTGICGGSAIAALAPVVKAKDSDVSYALSVTFLFDMGMVILFPLMGRAMGLTDAIFGFWTGTAVNDTSSVVAASFAFSEAAGEIATMVKLTRTLAIIPTVIIFAFITLRKQYSETRQKETAVSLSVRELFPWFILFFLVMAGFNTAGLINVEIAGIVRSISRFLMVIALAAIGLKTDLNLMRQTGSKPFIHGLILSTLVVIVSLIVTLFLFS